MRQSFPSPGVVTQAAFRPTAIDPTEPGAIAARRTIRPERSSRRTTEPSTPSTQTPAAPVATAAAGTSRIVAVIAPVVASGPNHREVRRDCPERFRPTPRGGCRRGSTSSLPSSAGRLDVRSVRVVGSRRATAVATGPMNCVSCKRPAVGDPDRPGAERDVRRRRAGRERLDDTRGRNDAKHGPRVRIHEPESAVADRERGRSAPGRDAAHDLARPGVDADHRFPRRRSRSNRPRRRRAARPQRALQRRALSRSPSRRARSSAFDGDAPASPARAATRRGSRIACWSSWSSGPGSSPSSETSVCRASAYASSASD